MQTREHRAGVNSSSSWSGSGSGWRVTTQSQAQFARGRTPPPRGLRMAAEYVKLALLLALMLLVVWSAGNKYWRYEVGNRVAIRTLTADYNLYCRNSSDKYDECKAAIDAAVADASDSCKGYLEKEAACFSSFGQGSGRCQSKTSAVDGCVSLVCTTALAKAGLPAPSKGSR